MTDEELERALFSLELEAPPAELRESIMLATVHAPVLRMRSWEYAGVGVLMALGVWLAIAMVTHRSHVGSELREAFEFFTNPEVAVWLAIGGGISLWMTVISNLTSRTRVSA
jgi:hypothetical protein